MKKDNTQIVEERINTIISIYKNGGNIRDAEKFLKSIGRGASISLDLHAVNVAINQNSKRERDILINTHVKRYEKIFAENISKTMDDFAHLKPHIARFMLIDCYVIAMEALVAKEKILGLHTKNFRVQLNNYFKKKIIRQYNFSHQLFSDLVRLKELLEKMKRTDDQVQLDNDVQIVEEVFETQAVVDVDHIEINDKNAAKIKEIVKDKHRSNGKQKKSLEDVIAKILKEDIKKQDIRRQDMLAKLSKLNNKK